MKKASFTFNFDSKSDAKIILESVNPEVKHKIPKTDVEILISENKLFLNIVASDTSSLRAAVNSYLRWMITALNVKKIF